MASVVWRLARYGLPVAGGASLTAMVAFGIAVATTGGEESTPVTERYHRIAAGPVDQPGFALGRRLATVISLPVGAPGCPPVEGCGVAGLIAVATSAGVGPVDDPAETHLPARTVSVATATAGHKISIRTQGDSDFLRFKDRGRRSCDAVIVPLSGPVMRTPLPDGLRLVGVLAGAAAERRFAWLVGDHVPDRTVFAMAAAVWDAGQSDPSLRLLPPDPVGAAAAAPQPMPPWHPGVWSFFLAIDALVAKP